MLHSICLSFTLFCVVLHRKETMVNLEVKGRHVQTSGCTDGSPVCQLQISSLKMGKTTTRTEIKKRLKGGVWRSSLSPRSRQPSWPRIPDRRPRCRSGSSPSRRPRGIASARSRTKRWSWKPNPSLPTAAVTAQRASRSPATSSGKGHTSVSVHFPVKSKGRKLFWSFQCFSVRIINPQSNFKV